jgi:hypothetical protein
MLAPALAATSVRALLSRRAFAELREALTASPTRLGELWPKLAALERAACWRLLPTTALATAAKSLAPAARWEAYLASSTECVAPLLEDAHIGARAFFRKPTRREAALLRAGIRS